ncbi:MAG: DUF547 domain-containing protein [Candidatus Cloacimonetes bacterium]|nr:DUF547 domain-containing protein [Candidatus Cloacimonadota bacterium]
MGFGFRLLVINLFLVCSVNGSDLELKELQDYFLAWDKYLLDHVSDNGLMRYDKAQEKSSMSDLNRMLDFLKNYSPLRLKGLQKKSFWINTYNLCVHAAVLKYLNGRRPQAQDTVQKIPGIWTDKICHFRGFSLSLNEIEKTVLLEHFQDPTIHFGLVCASKGCPRLWRAFFPETVNSSLRDLGAQFIKKSTVINTDRETIGLSRLFDWYQHHFSDADGLVSGLKHHFSDVDLLQGLDSEWQIEWIEYDWSLNAEP